MSIHTEAYVLIDGQWWPCELKTTPVQSAPTDALSWTEELRKLKNWSATCHGFSAEGNGPTGPVVEGSVEERNCTLDDEE